MTHAGQKDTLRLVGLSGQTHCFLELLLKLLALGDIDPAAQQPLQLSVGSEERDRPLPDVHAFSGQFDGAVGKDWLVIFQQVEVVGMHLLSQCTRYQIDIRKASTIHLLETDAKALLVATVAGNQSSLEIANINRIGDTIEQGVFEGQLVIELPFSLEALANLYLEATAPDQ